MTSERISLRQYCELSQTDISFMHSLNDAGIITFSWQEKEAFIGEEDIPALECYAHLYYDLQINIEGIDAIRHLLSRIKGLQDQLKNTEALLKIFEFRNAQETRPVE